jgi:protein-tyrosine phosphatase
MSEASGGVFRVLLVCTGNVCRSPLAERLLRRELDGVRCELGGFASELVIESAGTRALVGEPMDPRTAAVALDAGVDPDGHRARQLEAEQVAAAGLVLGLAREHRSAAVRLVPRANRYAFTLVEFARLAHDLVGAGEGAGRAAALPSLIGAISARRGLSAPPEQPDHDDVADPIGLPSAAHVAAAARITDAVTSIGASARRVAGGARA